MFKILFLLVVLLFDFLWINICKADESALNFLGERKVNAILLRSSPIQVSEIGIEDIVYQFNFFDIHRNQSGDFKNEFIQNDNGTITDLETGLCWQTKGSPIYMTHPKAINYINNLNKKAFAGFSDWRLPTITELASLIENNINSDLLFIDPLFSPEQRYCWTSDRRSINNAWYITFISGGIFWDDINNRRYIRAVRSPTMANALGISSVQLNSLEKSHQNKNKPTQSLQTLPTQPIPSDTTSYPSQVVVTPSLKSKIVNPDGIAVIIGNNKYDHKDIPEVIYARNDAIAMKAYLIEALGYKDGNIIFKTDSSKPDLEMIFGIKDNHKGILYDYIKPNKSDVFIYYSGHGAPDINTNKAYFVTKNCNPDKIGFTGYALDIFYENISKLPAKQITVVIDACFSGGTDSGESLVTNASPALINVSNPIIGKDNIAILTSSKSNQISSWYLEKRHGLFTYFFLQAVNGEADKDNNRKITYREIYDYVTNMTEGVPYWAKRLHGGRVQMPTMQTLNMEKIFITY